MAKMKFDINGTPWTAQLANPWNEGLTSNGKDLLGASWNSKQKIYIATEGAKEAQRKTFIHELCHATLSEFDIMSERESFTEEELCNFVASQFDRIGEIVKKWEGWSNDNGKQ